MLNPPPWHRPCKHFLRQNFPDVELGRSLTTCNAEDILATVYISLVRFYKGPTSSLLNFRFVYSSNFPTSKTGQLHRSCGLSRANPYNCCSHMGPQPTRSGPSSGGILGPYWRRGDGVIQCRTMHFVFSKISFHVFNG